MRKLESDQTDNENVLPVKKRAEIMFRTPRGCWIPACAGKTERFLGLQDEVWDGFESRNQSKIFSETDCQTSAVIQNSKNLTIQAESSANRLETFRCKSLNLLDLRTYDGSDGLDGIYFFQSKTEVSAIWGGENSIQNYPGVSRGFG